MNPQQQNQYDFILSTPSPQNNSSFNMQNSSKPKKILIMAVFLLFVFILIIVGFNFISSLGKVKNDDLVTVQAHQTELARVLEVGLKSLADQNNRNKVVSLQAALKTDQDQIASLLKDRSATPTKEQLASKKSSKTDTELETAEKTGNFDEVFIAKVETLSNDYYGSLKTALTDTSGNKEPEIIKTAMANLELVIAK